MHATGNVSSAWLRARFLELLHRVAPDLRLRDGKAVILCPVHAEKTASCSIDVERGIFHCFGCGVGGGVKKFAELLGEPWLGASLLRQERGRVAVALRRRAAEQKARALLQKREEERLDEIFDRLRAVDRAAAEAEELLALFYRRPDLESEFAGLAAQAARDYAEATHRRVRLEATEVEA